MTPRSTYSPEHEEARITSVRCAEVDWSDRDPKMRFIHSRRYLNKGEIVQLDCDTQCNFMLLTDADYAAYQRVERFRYYGGTFKSFPARITVPETGYWNIVIDLAGAKGEIKYNVTIVLDDAV